MENLLLQLLNNQLNEKTIGAIGQNLNVNDNHQISNASQSAINVLLNALTKNAGRGKGIESLMGALDRDHDGSILDDVLGFIQGAQVGQNPRMTNGAGILSHVLGDKLGGVVEAISQQNGLNQSQSMGLLEKLAPLVLGSLGKARRQEQMDERGLFDLLENSAESFNQPRQDDNLLTKLLDRDGDGNVTEELTGMGMKILGNLFRR